MNVTLYVTRDCNLNCSYCYAGRKREERMTLEQARDALNLAAGYSQFNFGVRFFGGEPLLEWDLVRQITFDTLTLAEKEKLLPSFSISTNALLLEEEHIRFFEEHDFAVGISIDGTQSAHDLNRRSKNGKPSFVETRDKFLQIRDRDVRLSVEIVADPSTIGDFAESIRFMVEELGVSFIIVSINIFADWTSEHMARIGEQYRRVADFYLQRFETGMPFEIDVFNNKMNVILREGYDRSLICHLGVTEITVVPDGRIYPCLRIVGSDEKGETIIGTLKEGLYKEKTKEMLAQSKITPSRCKECANENICVNWCASTNLVLSGSLSETGDFLCEYEKHVIDISRDMLKRVDLVKYREMYDKYLPQSCSRNINKEIANT